MSKLADARTKIQNEKIPFATKLSALERSVEEKRRSLDRLQRLHDNKSVSLNAAGKLFWNGRIGNTALGTAEDNKVVADVIDQASFSNSFDVNPLLFDDISADGTINPIPSSFSPAAIGAATIDTTLVG